MHGRSPIDIRPVRPGDAASLCAGINNVAAEKWVLATVRFSPEEIHAFLARSIENSFPHVVAVDGGDVVGWCDIVPGKAANGFGHVGRLGMGVRREWRGQGLGRRLLAACLRLAPPVGIEKVELEVYTDNQPAVRLYESMGFVKEGLKARARKLEGRYQDIQMMALWLDPSGGAQAPPEG
jgi:ribosomal protein S18 acetylase RimI-like enzyme